MRRILHLPYDEEELLAIEAGDEVILEGTLYVGRDQVHRRLFDALGNGEDLPFPFHGNAIYYMGPSPALPGFPIGAAGPTTSARMDPFSPSLVKAGLRVMVGKGPRKEEVRQSIEECGGLYLQAYGGCGALYSSCIRSSSVIAYPELGPEALLCLSVSSFPTVCIIDPRGVPFTGRA